MLNLVGKGGGNFKAGCVSNKNKVHGRLLITKLKDARGQSRASVVTNHQPSPAEVQRTEKQQQTVATLRSIESMANAETLGALATIEGAKKAAADNFLSVLLQILPPLLPWLLLLLVRVLAKDALYIYYACLSGM